jgi:hypothetical protein
MHAENYASFGCVLPEFTGEGIFLSLITTKWAPLWSEKIVSALIEQ